MKYFTMKELLGDNSISDVPWKHQRNLEDLGEKMDKFRAAYGKPMIVTSPYRSMQHHIDIYRTLALKQKRTFSMLQVPLGSKHLTGQAVDISDCDGKLYAFCEQNVPLLEEIGLWIEMKDGEKRVHFQTVPPASGKRFFRP